MLQNLYLYNECIYVSYMYTWVFYLMNKGMCISHTCVHVHICLYIFLLYVHINITCIVHVNYVKCVACIFCHL